MTSQCLSNSVFLFRAKQVFHSRSSRGCREKTSFYLDHSKNTRCPCVSVGDLVFPTTLLAGQAELCSCLRQAAAGWPGQATRWKQNPDQGVWEPASIAATQPLGDRTAQASWSTYHGSISPSQSRPLRRGHLLCQLSQYRTPMQLYEMRSRA